MANNFSPSKLIGAAIKAVPSVKYALGVAGIMAALALGKAFFASTAEALIGAAFMLVLMFLLVVFAAAARTPSSGLRTSALLATWSLLILFVASASFLVTSAFFSWPVSLSELAKQIRDGAGGNVPTNQPEAVTFSHDERVLPDNLPQRLVTPVSQGADAKAVLNALSAKGSLVLDGSTFTVGPIGANMSLTIAVHTLTLSHGARIVTNGNSLTIQAVDLVGGGSIIAFRPEDRTSSAAGPGQSGSAGHPGGSVFLDVAHGIDGNLAVDLTGQNGGTGGPGASGPAGPAGSRGSNGVQGLFDCHSGGQDGGPGGQGGTGQTGGDAGNGGDGGDLYVFKAIKEQANKIRFTREGGLPGDPGIGGPGGPGGPGGEGGSGSAMCSGGHGGPAGPVGPAGPLGKKGTPGKTGTLTFR